MGITENGWATSRNLSHPHPEERACRKFERGVRTAADLGRGSACVRVPLRCSSQHDSQGRPHFGETNPIGEHARERRTNLRLHKITAGVISLFPACYLQ